MKILTEFAEGLQHGLGRVKYIYQSDCNLQPLASSRQWPAVKAAQRWAQSMEGSDAELIVIDDGHGLREWQLQDTWTGFSPEAVRQIIEGESGIPTIWYARGEDLSPGSPFIYTFCHAIISRNELFDRAEVIADATGRKILAQVSMEYNVVRPPHEHLIGWQVDELCDWMEAKWATGKVETFIHWQPRSLQYAQPPIRSEADIVRSVARRLAGMETVLAPAGGAA